MKTLLVTASAFGLLTSAALADCAGHPKVTASEQVDRATTAASIAPDEKVLVVAKKKALEEQAVVTE
jgi:hypothetical protein